MPHLDELPAELIVQIASHTTPETVLALSQASRILRSTCYDALVFLNAFHDPAWAKKYLGHQIEDIDLIARYAVAESRHMQLLEQDTSVGETAVKPTLQELLRYLPSLALLSNHAPTADQAFLMGRRLCFQQGIKFEGEIESELKSLGTRRSLVSFMFACGLLQRCSQDSQNWSLHDHAEGSARLISYTYNSLAYGVRNETRDHVKDFHANCLLSLGKMAATIACTYPRHGHNPHAALQTLANGRANDVKVPGISKMFLAKSVSDVPSPFLPATQSLAAWNRWIRLARERQSAPEYLDSGEWEGVYTYQDPWGQFQHTSFDPKMKEIRFQSRRIGARGANFFAEGSGIDGVGDFDLRLTTGRDGFVRGRKAYRNQPTAWGWHLSNTPFGLYGLWTDESNLGSIGTLGGAVWLWKKEWVAE